MDLKNLFNNLIEKQLNLPETACKNGLKFSENTVNYYIDSNGVYTKLKNNQKKYLQIMFARKRKAKRSNILKFFDVIDPECFNSLSKEEQQYFYPVIKCCVYPGSHPIYAWTSIEDLLNFNFHFHLNEDKLYNKDFIDNFNKLYPMPNIKYFPNSRSRESFFNKKI